VHADDEHGTALSRVSHQAGWDCHRCSSPAVRANYVYQDAIRMHIMGDLTVAKRK